MGKCESNIKLRGNESLINKSCSFGRQPELSSVFHFISIVWFFIFVLMIFAGKRDRDQRIEPTTEFLLQEFSPGKVYGVAH